MKNMTFKEFQAVNAERAKLWHKHGIREWGLVDWTNATAGEAGELCNAAKKLQRYYDEIPGNVQEVDEDPIEFESELQQAVEEEIADTITYAFLVASHLELDVEKLIVDKFNQVSERNGFKIFLEE